MDCDIRKTVLSGMTFLLFATCLPLWVWADEALVARMSTEAVRGWQLHERAWESTSAVIHRKETVQKNGLLINESIQQLKVKFSLDGGSRFEFEQLLPKKSKPIIKSGGQNEKYHFRILNGGIQSVGFLESRSTQSWLTESDPLVSNFLLPIRGAYCVLGSISLPETLGKGELNIHSAIPLNEDGKSFVQVLCTLVRVKPTNPTTLDNVPLTITFDPSNGWAIQSIEGVSTKGTHRNIVCEYSLEKIKPSLLRPIHSLTLTDRSNEYTNTESYTFEELSHASIDPKELALSSFGFPEPIPPHGPGDSSNLRIWLTVLCIGVGSLFAGWYLRSRPAT